MNFKQSYREAAIRGASPVELTVRLYEQMIEDLRQAALALENSDIPRRTSRIKHAILVIGHLQSALDASRGGKVAQDLDNFYNALRQNVVQVQFHPSRLGFAQLITDLLAVRAAWIEVDRTEKPQAETPSSPRRMIHSSNEEPAANSDSQLDWQG
jgi:flagellar biosynthetic protein FliS